ncbi:MAG: cobalamin-binding protein [Porticoccaceae bacterium]|nr:MAG: cobalamin-binding protein [Porticoccaceae bacterium]
MKQLLVFLAGISIALGFSTTAFAEIRLKDAMGRDVVLAKPAQRIVSLAPHITEIVFAAGAGEQLVGAVSYSDYPDAAKQIARVGSYNSVSYESIVALNPDLVIVWQSGNGEEVVQRLASLGLNLYVTQPDKLEDVALSLRHIGILSGNVKQGDSAADKFRARLTELKNTYSQQSTVEVYYQLWNEPMMTMNGEHLISDVIRLCGGHNVFADALPLVPRISVESVVRANPQVIIASGMDQARPEWLDDWRDWTSIDAVHNEQLYFIPPELLQRHTPRIIQGAEQMCTFLAQARDQREQQNK